MTAFPSKANALGEETKPVAVTQKAEETADDIKARDIKIAELEKAIETIEKSARKSKIIHIISFAATLASEILIYFAGGQKIPIEPCREDGKMYEIRQASFLMPTISLLVGLIL